jgi:hypothetical protein
MREFEDIKGPVATPVAPPPKPKADVVRAPWDALPLPVCPRLLKREARAPMAALALFARALSEAAEAPGGRDERIGRVETLELALSGAFGPALRRPELLPAVILRDVLLETGGSFNDMLALADAAKDDIAGAAFPDERALLDHAARATAPVLRYLMHLHGVREEPLLARADDLARAWHILERKDVPDATRLAGASLERAGDLSAAVADRRLKAQLYRLQALAKAALRAPGAGLAGVSALTRLRTRLMARLKLWTGW